MVDGMVGYTCVCHDYAVHSYLLLVFVADERNGDNEKERKSASERTHEC